MYIAGLLLDSIAGACRGIYPLPYPGPIFGRAPFQIIVRAGRVFYICRGL